MKFLENEPLSVHTTFHLGGKARYFCEVNSLNELKEALGFAKAKKLPYFILGGGSNVVADDGGYGGVVIKLKVESPPAGEAGYKVKGIYIEAEAGVSLATVVSESLKNGLVGIEWAWGIPGTIGGAVRGNAGAYGGEMKDSIQSVKVLRNGKVVVLENKDCGFGYRESVFKKNSDIILSVRLRLNKKNSDGSTSLTTQHDFINKVKEERAGKFSGGYSAGSFFKNIVLSEKKIKEFQKKFPDLSEQSIKNKVVPAAWLIDQCGLKGFCVGGICVSEKHAGVILNLGVGTSDQLYQLVGIVKMKVRDKFGVELEEEIVYLRNTI